MALPTLITITGTYLKADGSPEEGTVVFRSKVTAYHNSSSSILAPDTRMVELNGSGSFSIQVPATDDPNWIPVGWTYKVSVNLGESVTTFNTQVPYDAPGGTVSISSLAPVASSGGSGGSSGDLANYIPKSVVTAKGDILVATGSGDVSKISVGTNGQVLKADSTKTTGLVWANESGGGGAVSSVNGYTGAVSLVKADIGLGNVDNTSDANKPVSTATQTALNGKEATIASGTTGQYWRGDKSWQTLDKTAVGLGNVDNTSDANKPISTATQTALDGKAATSHNHDSLYIRKDLFTTKGDLLVITGAGAVTRLPVGVNGQVLKANSAASAGVEWGTDNTASGGGGGAVTSVNGQTGDVTLTKTDIGLGNVDNTSDASKPVSTATQTALDGKQDVDSDLTAIAALTPTNNDIIQRKTGVWTNRTPAQFKTDLSLAKGDVGLGNVDNIQQQPLDSDLTAIAALAPANDDIIQRKTGAWVNRTVAQFKSDLALTKSDVGLGNVDNTSDVNKPISTATQSALDGKQASDSDLTAIAAIAPANDDIIQRKAGAWTNRTVAQFKSDLSLTKSDVGLANVDNTSDVNKPISTATQTALNGKQDLDSDLTAIAAIAPTNDDIIQRKAGAWTNRTVAQFKSDLSLTKTDVGLGNVDNTSDANKPVSTAQATAIALKPDLKAWNGASYSAISNGVIYVGGSTDPTVNNGDIWIDTSSATNFSVTNDLTVGGNLTVSGIGATVSKVRSTNATARSTASMTADDVLTATLGLGTWVITVKAIYLGSDGTADFQISYTAPTGSMYNRVSSGILASNTATGASDKAINHQAAVAVGTGMVFATTTTADFAEETLIYNVTTAGTFSVNWARSGASGSATLLAGSYFLAQRIA